VARHYSIGTGIAEVTDRAAGLPLQGMADTNQISTGVDAPLFARAFTVTDRDTGHSVAVVVADIWSGTRRVKDAVVRRLSAVHRSPFGDENVLLAGTHTHSAPGGYSGMLLYDYTDGGVDDATVQCIVQGCVKAIEMAQANLGPGRIYLNRGQVADCGRNRSPQAYVCNPQAERDRYGADTDSEMLLLKFVKVDESGDERPVGALSWYPIHPTDYGQKNTLISGDNKGFASGLFETAMGTDPHGPETFVAAFANANCGDVSGSVELGHIPDGVHDREQVEKHGRQQFEVARELFETATEEVTGPVDYRHTRVDFSQVQIDDGGDRTWPAAFGVSFAAGSSEDSVPVPNMGVHEGMAVSNLTEAESMLTDAMRVGLSTVVGVNVIQYALATREREGHLPKPVVVMPGIEHPPAVPQILPVQLLRIGTVAVLGIPGEITTMAGRRLRESTLGALSVAGVRSLALGTYANEYSSYVTTTEEYGSQQYEGASTLFGPHTLAAYQQVAAGLAAAIVGATAVGAGPEPTAFTAAPQRRYRFRNLSDSAVKLQCYNTNDHQYWLTLPNGTKTIGAHAELAFAEREFTGRLLPTIRTVQVRLAHHRTLGMSAGQLMTIAPDGSISVTNYRPPWQDS
jgi:neutral ceramidase